jgi:uncharacterized protein (UPF0335 family)
MRIPGVHDPDPTDPKGMAFLFAAGMCDPRPGGYPKSMHPNQIMALKESWEPTSSMYWDLGIRYHPELATKWLEGGGQFTVAQVVDKPPEELDNEELARQMAEDQYQQMVEEIERVKKHGTPYQKKRLYQRFKQAGVQAAQMAEMLKAGIEEGGED